MTETTADAHPSKRPLIHLTPETGWVNDPLGLTWHAGRYHLFTQHVPGRVEWAPDCHWAHAVSDDLMTWQQRPVALSPGDGDDGVWSGSIVLPIPGVDDPVGVQLYYTSVDLTDVGIGRIRVAVPVDDGWDTWTKGPVIAELPAGIDAVAFRDPYVFHDGSSWRMVVGGGLRDGTAVAWSWVSADRLGWHFDGELARRASLEHDPVWTGAVWECPVVFPLEDRWVLVFSVWEPGVPHWVGYAIGDLIDGRFEATTWGRLSHGPSYYASSTFIDVDGRRGLVHWLRGVRDPNGHWAGAASIPHILHLHGDLLVAQPHPNATTGPIVGTIAPGERTPLPAACWVEWDAHTDPGSPHGPSASLEITTADETLVLRLDRRGDHVVTATPDLSAAVPGGESDRVGLLIDALVVEVFTPNGILAVPLPPATSLLATTRGSTKASVRKASAATEPGAQREPRATAPTPGRHRAP